MPRVPRPLLKSVEWVGTAKDDVSAFPDEVKSELGQSLFAAQLGDLADNAKPMKGALREVIEIVAKGADGTYRLMYAVKLGQTIYALHAFQKKISPRHLNAR